MDFYIEYQSLFDTALVIGVALSVWVGYRELRNRKRDEQPARMSNSPAL
jgi:hypothetical protein